MNLMTGDEHNVSRLQAVHVFHIWKYSQEIFFVFGFFAEVNVDVLFCFSLQLADQQCAATSGDGGGAKFKSL